MPRPAPSSTSTRAASTRSRPLAEVLAIDFPWCEPHRDAIAAAVPGLRGAQARPRQLDFDDLLLYWRAALGRRAPRARPGRAMFDHVLVDEYQDVNTPAGRHREGAAPDRAGPHRRRRRRPGGLRLPGRRRPPPPRRSLGALPGRHRGARWSATSARCSPSWTSPTSSGRPRRRRAPRPAGEPDRRAAARCSVRCHDAPAEARAGRRAPSSTTTSRAWLLREQAVLVRAAHHSDLIELELTARRVPYRKYGGLRFVEAAHVKDFVAAFRLLDNPADDLAWFRLLRLHEGIGPGPGPGPGGRARCGRATACGRTGPRPWPRPRRGPGSPSPPPSRPWPRRAAARSRPGPTPSSPCSARSCSRATPTPAARLSDLERLARRPRRGRRPRRLGGRDHPRPAAVHRGPGRPAPPRRGLRRHLDRPLGQGARVDGRSTCPTSSTAPFRPTWPCRAPRGWQRSGACSTWP